MQFFLSTESRWIHVSGQLMEQSAFAVIIPEDSSIRPIVLAFSQSNESDYNESRF